MFEENNSFSQIRMESTTDIFTVTQCATALTAKSMLQNYMIYKLAALDKR